MGQLGTADGWCHPTMVSFFFIFESFQLVLNLRAYVFVCL